MAQDEGTNARAVDRLPKVPRRDVGGNSELTSLQDDGADSTDARFSPDGKAILVMKDGEKPDPIPLMMPLPLN